MFTSGSAGRLDDQPALALPRVVALHRPAGEEPRLAARRLLDDERLVADDLDGPRHVVDRDDAVPGVAHLGARRDRDGGRLDVDREGRAVVGELQAHDTGLCPPAVLPPT